MSSGEEKVILPFKMGNMIARILMILSACIVILSITTLVYGSNEYIFTTMYVLSSSILLILVSTVSAPFIIIGVSR
jgi:hypothetical protein